VVNLVDQANNKTKLFNYIVEFKRTNDGCSPTYRQLRDGCGISSTSVVTYWLGVLERDGLIERSTDEARAIRVVGAEWVYDRPMAD
jgi:SOS-response transcriptional repressor LexA